MQKEIKLIKIYVVGMIFCLTLMLVVTIMSLAMPMFSFWGDLIVFGKFLMTNQIKIVTIIMLFLNEISSVVYLCMVYRTFVAPKIREWS